VLVFGHVALVRRPAASYPKLVVFVLPVMLLTRSRLS